MLNGLQNLLLLSGVVGIQFLQSLVEMAGNHIFDRETSKIILKKMLGNFVLYVIKMTSSEIILIPKKVLKVISFVLSQLLYIEG